MLTALTRARIITPDEDIRDGTVLIEDGRILQVGAGVRVPEGASVIELPGLTLAPGFIDIHVHGGGGFSLATNDPGELRSYARWCVRHGVTSFLASVVAERPEAAEPHLDAAARAAGPVPEGAELLGVHLEGPFVNPARRGALPEGWLHAPDIALFRRLSAAARGSLRVITVAPELPDAHRLIEAATAAGALVALGHSDATYEQARAGFAAGARHLTHAFNAMRLFHHREPGLPGAALESSGVSVELIADGVHVHPAAARLVVAAGGPEAVALITDGVPPAGLEEGSIQLGGREARLSEGRVTLPDGTIAGSAATMDAVVRNVVDWGLASVTDAVRMASSTPARVVGLGDRKGHVSPGYDADLIALDASRRVVAVWARGGPILSPNL